MSQPWNRPFLLEALVHFSGTKVWELSLLVATLVFAVGPFQWRDRWCICTCMHVPAFQYRDTHAYTYMHAYICAHKHSHTYFRSHEFTPIPPVAIHSQRVLSCLPAFHLCISSFHSENSSFQQRHIYSFVPLNPLVHLKEFQNCFAYDITINNVRRRVWDLFVLSLPIYPRWRVYSQILCL